MNRHSPLPISKIIYFSRLRSNSNDNEKISLFLTHRLLRID